MHLQSPLESNGNLERVKCLGQTEGSQQEEAPGQSGEQLCLAPASSAAGASELGRSYGWTFLIYPFLCPVFIFELLPQHGDSHLVVGKLPYPAGSRGKTQ